MRIVTESGTVLMRGRAHWLRAAFEQAALRDDGVVLAPAPDDDDDAAVGAVGEFAGLAFDAHCRLFHARPQQGALEQVMWRDTTGLGAGGSDARPFPVTGAATEVDGDGVNPLRRPRALAAGAGDYLYVADVEANGGVGAVWLIDIWQAEIARRVDFAAAPLDLARCGDGVFALLANGEVWYLTPCDPPRRTDWPIHAGAERLAVTTAEEGGLLAWVLRAAGQADARLLPLHDGAGELPVPWCGDLVALPEDAEFGATLILAHRPGEPFRRLRVRGYHSAPLPDLMAVGYDGAGIEPTEDGRVVYWTAAGPRHAAPAPARYRCFGRVLGHALDSGIDGCSWGRLLVEACVPAGTAIRFHAFSADDIEHVDPLPRQPPHGEALADIAEAEVTPLLSAARWQRVLDDDTAARPLYRDPSARPLAPAAEPGHARYEAPLAVPPGRYLWLVFELTGTRGRTPRLLSARAEYPGHDLLSRLPRTLWREAGARDFLDRLLTPIAAMLNEWEAVAAGRHRLLDARVAPAEALPWLAGFIGLALDPCWPEAVRRGLILEAAALFRTRGTVASLRCMLEILTEGAEVIIVEHFRLRGGGVVGNAEVNAAQAVLGGGFRVGARLAPDTPDGQGAGRRDGAPEVGEIAEFDRHAHRFTVILVVALDDQRLDCARRLVHLHKPAHTEFDLCAADNGLRVGVGAHVGVATVIGRGAGFERGVLGDAALGAGHLLGRAELDASAGGEP